MAGTSRIDELRKKFDENPRRYFAPLANEYRKIGDFEQAIFICQEFLPQQPGHMSGHIVYGQALFESGRHDEARSVFETALALDPENLIALRHLGDIARARGDTETARAWYRRVLESDPRNEEISGILNSLDTDVPAMPAAAPRSEASPSETAGGALTTESAIGAATGSESAPAVAPSSDPIVTDPLTTAPPESSFDDIAGLFTSPAPASSTDDSLNLIHEGEDVLGSSHTEPSAGGASHPPISRHGAPKAESLPAETPTAFSMPFLDSLTSAAPPAAPPVAVTQPEPPSPDASTAFVTETMAELYIKQGHHDQAIDVYRQLVQRNPNDSALAARLRELESAQRRVVASAKVKSANADAVSDAGPTIREFLGSIADFRLRTTETEIDLAPSVEPQRPATPSPNEPRSSRGGAETVGGSLTSLFGGAEREAPTEASPHFTSSAPPPRNDARSDAAELPGRPSTPAATELSLDHVFRHATPAAGGAAHSSFSFDQFFSQQAQQDVAASDAERSTEESAGLSDDIQQFNAWLEGLKKT